MTTPPDHDRFDSKAEYETALDKYLHDLAAEIIEHKTRLRRLQEKYRHYTGRDYRGVLPALINSGTTTGERI